MYNTVMFKYMRLKPINNRREHTANERNVEMKRNERTEEKKIK